MQCTKKAQSKNYYANKHRSCPKWSWQKQVFPEGIVSLIIRIFANWLKALTDFKFPNISYRFSRQSWTLIFPNQLQAGSRDRESTCCLKVVSCIIWKTDNAGDWHCRPRSIILGEGTEVGQRCLLNFSLLKKCPLVGEFSSKNTKLRVRSTIIMGQNCRAKLKLWTSYLHCQKFAVYCGKTANAYTPTSLTYNATAQTWRLRITAANSTPLFISRSLWTGGRPRWALS